MSKTIIIIGLGDLGGAMLHLLANKNFNNIVGITTEEKKREIEKTGKNPFSKKLSDISLPIDKFKLYSYEEASEILPLGDIIILTVPAVGLPKTFDLLEKHISKKKGVAIVLTSKSADSRISLNPIQLAKKTFKFRKFPLATIAMLSVIGYAKRIAEKEMTNFVISLPRKNVKTKRLLQRLFSARYVITDVTYDPGGACIAGMLKNVFAIIIGICEGLEKHPFSDGETIQIGVNTKALLMKRLNEEVHLVAKQQGMLLKTWQELKEDLELSTKYQEGRNYTFGFDVAKGKSIEAAINDIGVVEGIGATHFLDKEVPGTYFINPLARFLREEISLEATVGIILNDIVNEQTTVKKEVV